MWGIQASWLQGFQTGDGWSPRPIIPGLLHDEPTIEAMNRMGLDFNSVGNHEFNEGPAELLRMQQGGTHPDEDADGETFARADLQFPAVDVIWSPNE